MEAGRTVIVQGALLHEGWSGRADVLRRVGTPSRLGAWSYEVTDTKLARETKAGTILQLCLYSELVARVQGREPEYMDVVPPWTEFTPQRYRYHDFVAFYRKAKRGLEAWVATPNAIAYPEPKPHCDICRWAPACDRRRRDDDHLCLVADITKVQITELKRHDLLTTSHLAEMPLPLTWKPERGAVQSYQRLREQARIQVEERLTGERRFELQPVEAGFGLCLLPEPSDGDVFFDIEGDPYVGEGGLEYLFGFTFKEESGDLAYRAEWAFSRADEKRTFERFIDFVMERWANHPGLHVYHYAPYEPAALKRLIGRYATREEAVDRLLRAKVFVDLYGVVRRAVRASVESYSLKRLEPFYCFEREVALPDANAALFSLQTKLERGEAVPDGAAKTVQNYNSDDCRSTQQLRLWLETLRQGLLDTGTAVPRPASGDGAPPEKISAWALKINELVERLTAGVPEDTTKRTSEQHARWLLAHILDWHRREKKATWWELYRLSALSAEDLLDERAGVASLRFVGSVGGTEKAPIHRYSFPSQDADLLDGDELRSAGGARYGSVHAVSPAEQTIDIKKRKDTADQHAEAVFGHNEVDDQVCADALVRIGEFVATHGVIGDGSYGAARALLTKASPVVADEPLQRKGEPTLEAALRLCDRLTHGVVPIQGPPGAGKTFAGAHMICALVAMGKKVGITANSHKVIRNLIKRVLETAKKQGIQIHCCHKTDDHDAPIDGLSVTRNSERLLQGIGTEYQVGGGTAWLWSRADAFNAVDVLFVDEAAQMSLANVLAVSHAAPLIVLLGDPQQLDQPMQGTHPDGTGVSALHHILDGEQTISPSKGLFLEETWRLHPAICWFTSELFYEGKLRSKQGLERQIVDSTGLVRGAGLRLLSVPHDGNQNCSPEEAEAIERLVKGILANNATWTDRCGETAAIGLEEILIIAPYNAQVFEIQRRLPTARVGTVDKFQGQEAPIAIYSMATSSHADAPRGMEFLYSLNRLNVATSRAMCLSILVASPQVFEADCRSPRQIQLANAFCRFVERAEPITDF